MDFKDCFKQLAERVSKLKEQILTEEATKNAFIMPFIQMLGYDVFNPMEVVPEMDCDISKKKGEKIDYAIMKDDEPIMLIECKHWKQNLDLHGTQLQRYFVASKARFGVLTNGIVYRFYSDLDNQNIMDDQPFLEVNLEDPKGIQIEELKKFHKSYFDVDNILSTAAELKYMAEIKSVLRTEFSNPSAEFVKLLTKQVYNGIVTAKVMEQFTDLTKKALGSYINDLLSDRLNIAIRSTENGEQNKPAAIETAPATTEETTVEEEKPKIVTTEEEIEGFYIVKAVLRTVIPAERITYRDAQSYFAIFCDNNNRKPLCRLYFNNPKNKQLGIINEDKTDYKVKLETLDDIMSYTEELKRTAEKYV